jgi:hypothetical protein
LRNKAIIFALLIATPAFAEPDEATKRNALMQAYEMNGNSMVGWGSINLEEVRIIKTDRIKAPIVNATEKNELDASADKNVCEKHHLRKVQFRKRWRCKR